MQALYFAYGSNLVSSRMCERVPSAALRGRARLHGRRLTLDKLGRDGTGKANLRDDPSGVVWGVVWELAGEHWALLDACERGYERIRVEVVDERAARLLVETYVSRRLTPEPVPTSLYRGLLLEGAREQGLPQEYLRWLHLIPERGVS